MDDAARRQLNRDMAALADGDRDAFDAVYRTMWPLLVRFMGAVCGERTVAEDMAQQAMMKVMAKASTFDRARDALAWSMGVAVNEYRSYRRKRGNRPTEPLDLASSARSDDEDPEAVAISNDLGDAARSVLRELRPQDLEVVLAAIYETARPPVTGAAFRKRLQRAMENTRQIWKSRYGDR